MDNASASKFIPVGRTSLVRKEGIALQVQTEYAYRPYPRITTTISNNGRVIHKVEKKLLRPVLSPEEMDRMERTMTRQHKEIVGILDNASMTSTLGLAQPPVATEPGKTVSEQLGELPGVDRVFQLDNDGNFIGDKSSQEFKHAFAPIFKNLRELMDVFAQIPGADYRREQGVYEVEPNRLYFVSSGTECFFLIVNPNGHEIDYEASIKAIIS